MFSIKLIVIIWINGSHKLASWQKYALFESIYVKLRPTRSHMGEGHAQNVEYNVGRVSVMESARETKWLLYCWCGHWFLWDYNSVIGSLFHGFYGEVNGKQCFVVC